MNSRKYYIYFFKKFINRDIAGNAFLWDFSAILYRKAFENVISTIKYKKYGSFKWIRMLPWCYNIQLSSTFPLFTILVCDAIYKQFQWPIVNFQTKSFFHCWLLYCPNIVFIIFSLSSQNQKIIKTKWIYNPFQNNNQVY